MRNRTITLAVVGGVAAAIVAGAAILGGVSTPAPAGSPGPSAFPGLPGFASAQPIAGCIEQIPAPIDEPQFRPENLVLPAGSFATASPSDPAPGLHVVVYAVPTTLEAFVDHVLAEWPAAGWVLGRGEREPGEAESVFYRPDKSRYGQFRARQVFCDPESIEVTLTIGENVRNGAGSNRA